MPNQTEPLGFATGINMVGAAAARALLASLKAMGVVRYERHRDAYHFDGVLSGHELQRAVRRARRGGTVEEEPWEKG